MLCDFSRHQETDDFLGYQKVGSPLTLFGSEEGCSPRNAIERQFCLNLSLYQNEAAQHDFDRSGKARLATSDMHFGCMNPETVVYEDFAAFN